MSGKNTLTSDGGAKKRFDFKAWWGGLDAKKRQMYSLAGAGGVLVLFAMAIASTGNDKGPTRDVRQTRMENALLPEDGGRELGLAGVSRGQQELSQQSRELENKVDRLSQQLDRLQSSNGAQSQAQRMEAELESLRQELAALKVEGSRSRPNAEAPQVPGLGAAPAGPQVAPPPPPAAEIRSVGGAPAATTGTAPPARSNAEVLAEREEEREKSETENYLPSGTMITGVLLTGIDAPTGRAALRDPLPVLLRVKREAVLPNRYRADYKECFMLLEAVGDLPSERAMMRTNGMSCVRQDRTVIDVPVQGFAVGEDGKAGLRGLVVSKQGQAISKAMLAGFADGVSRAFGGNNNQMSNLGGGELPSGSDIGTSGVMGGASSALDRIAQHFLDLAEQLHPVIEINSGREVTVILTQGRTMAGRSGAEGRRGEGR
jgi:conjugal transfer pilus assembly protein TraB